MSYNGNLPSKIMYSGDPTVGIKSIPLLIQHPTQLLVASLLLNAVKSWVSKDPVPSDAANMLPLEAA
jgi:hypothetical protein